MTEVVALENFSLLPQGPTVSLGLAPGQSLAVVGPAAGGKSRFIRCLCGNERSAQGSVHALGKAATAGRDAFSRRSNPQSIVRHAMDGRKGGHAADALTSTGLWELRQKPITELSSSQIAACELLSCLAPDARLMIIDGQLDRLDPWTLSSVMTLLRKRLSELETELRSLQGEVGRQARQLQSRTFTLLTRIYEILIRAKILRPRP